MKKYLGALFVLLAFSVSAYANTLQEIPVDSVEVDSDENFVNCTLTDGRKLMATLNLVIVGNTILAKNVTTAAISSTAEFLWYDDHGFEVSVYKQFCGREGLQGVSILNKKTGEQSSLSCIEKVSCND